MCESCKAYEEIWHGVEVKMIDNSQVALGRINMDDPAGAAMAEKFSGLLDGGIPTTLWVADPSKPYEYKTVDPGQAKTPKDLWIALVYATGDQRGMLIPQKEEL